MLLAIDIGNTNISCALFRGAKIIRSWDIPSERYSKAKLANRLKGRKPGTAFICSVVPALTRKLCADIIKVTGISPQVIGKDIRVSMKSLYRYPGQLGQDRLVNAYAAVQLYAAPVIIVSCGTAITIDAVSKNKVYIGGLIQPGLSLSLSALNLKTALLPKIKLNTATGLLGRDTRSSILNGVILGTAAGIDALIAKIKLNLGRHAQVVGTGGNILLLRKFLKNVDRVDSDLILKGIYLIKEESHV